MKTATTARIRPIDGAWFKAQIAASRFRSLRGIAPHVTKPNGYPMDIRSASQVFSGLRRMQMGEARQFADLLGIPLADVLRHAGIDVRDKGDDLEARHRAAVRMIGTLLAFIDEAGVNVPPKVRAAARAIA